MIKFVASDRIPYKTYDYVFTEVSEFEEINKYLKQKLNGEWVIVFLRPDLVEIKKLMDVKTDLDITVVTSQSNIDELHISGYESQTRYEKFIQIVGKSKVQFEQKALYELYRRIAGNFEKLETYLEEMEKVENKVFTKRDVQSYVPDDSSVYASDVLRAFLMNKWNKWSLLMKFKNSLGNKYAYYALRKSAFALVKDKEALLTGNKCKYFFTEEINGYRLAKMIELILEQSPDSFDLIFINYERGISNDSLFKRETFSSR